MITSAQTKKTCDKFCIVSNYYPGSIKIENKVENGIFTGVAKIGYTRYIQRARYGIKQI